MASLSPQLLLYPYVHTLVSNLTVGSFHTLASLTHYLFQVVHEGITFLACTQVEMPPLMAIEFLSGATVVLSDYLGSLIEDLIKDNFVIVYGLLDEMIDNGFPLTTEPNILREMIAPPNIVSKVLSFITGNVCNRWNFGEMCDVWRSSSKFHLSYLPDLTLSFVNPSILNDVRFHPCVRLRLWEANQILSFVPPDGEFKLLRYRVKKLKSTPIYVNPQLSLDSGTCLISVLVGIRNDPGKSIGSITVQF
ncbi:unnamed protein product [Fraxinus pennsylvanica]|uniref:MHD domain-containing protein n=1 Tax=Fraxinus pennsylvanica TaxID=56036 RepID=A0AAD2DZC1_9LAMI|nr:unnamed protein product [Fraxinus pennsylvanica]